MRKKKMCKNIRAFILGKKKASDLSATERMFAIFAIINGAVGFAHAAITIMNRNLSKSNTTFQTNIGRIWL